MAFGWIMVFEVKYMITVGYCAISAECEVGNFEDWDKVGKQDLAKAA